MREEKSPEQDEEMSDEAKIDEQEDESFPASDPQSNWAGPAPRKDG